MAKLYVGPATLCQGKLPHGDSRMQCPWVLWDSQTVQNHWRWANYIWFKYAANMLHMFIFNHIMIYLFCFPKKYKESEKGALVKENIYQSSNCYPRAFTSRLQKFKHNKKRRFTCFHIKGKPKIGARCDGWNVLPHELGSLSSLCWRRKKIMKIIENWSPKN